MVRQTLIIQWERRLRYTREISWRETRGIRRTMAPWTLVAVCSGNQWRCQRQPIAVKTIHMRTAQLISSKTVMKLTLGQEIERIDQDLRFARTLPKYSQGHPGQADTMRMEWVIRSLLEVQELPQVARVAPRLAAISAKIDLNSRPHT